MDQSRVIEKIKAGDEGELEAIYIKYRKEFLNWITRYYSCSMDDGKDIYQATIIAFFEGIVSGKLTLMTSSVKTYLFAIGKNKIQELNRTLNKEVMIEALEEDHHFYVPRDFDEDEDLLKIVEKCLGKLGDPCKSILELYYYKKLSFAQISEKLNYKNSDTCKNLKYKCLLRLKKIYETETENSK